MRVIRGGQKKQVAPDLEKQRRGLLAKVHIAVKELGITEENYRNILKIDYGVASALALSIEELEDFMKRCEASGWKPKHTREGKRRQIKALQYRAREIAGEIKNGDRRLRGLCRRICGVEVLEWCRDIHDLRRFLAVMESIKRQEANKVAE